MSSTLPQTVAADAARSLMCRLCWAPPTWPCTVSGPPGDHLARYQQAETAGLITRADLAVVLAGLDVIAQAAIVSEHAA